MKRLNSMKYIKLYENINSDIYIKELNKEEFNNLFTNNCKNFKFDDMPLYRGVREPYGNTCYVNGKNRKFTYNRYYMTPLHLGFMSSDKWNGLPKKNKSLDFISGDGSMHRLKMYGSNVYRVIPYDNSTFVSNGTKLVGSYNKKLRQDGFNKDYLSSFFGDLVNFQDLFYKKPNNPGTIDDINYVINNLNKLFSGINIKFNKKNIIDYKEKIKNIPYDIKWLNSVLDKYDMTFVEYMEDAFSPKYYRIYDYDGMMGNEGEMCWTDNPVLMLKI